MNIFRLVWRELAYRQITTALWLLAVVVGVACVIGTVSLLAADQQQTQRILDANRQQTETILAANREKTRLILSEKEAAAKKAAKQYNDLMRKITKGLGFNVLIISQGDDRRLWETEATLKGEMPQQWVTDLANSKIMTVRHLLPFVARKITWPEQSTEEDPCEVVLFGTRGEIPVAHRPPKPELLSAVPEGQLILGHQIAAERQLEKGQTVKLLQREFTVAEVYPERGSIDDYTVWVNLAVAQELLNLQGRINGIHALECDCQGDRISMIRKEILSVLPKTQIIEIGDKALARAEAREKTKLQAEEALQRAKQTRQEVQQQVATARADVEQQAKNARREVEEHHEAFAALLVPLVLGACMLTIGFLAYGNAQQRASEIGIMRAIGMRAMQVLTAFITKAIIIGLLGGVLGYILGLLFGNSLAAPATEGVASMGSDIVWLAPELMGLAGVVAILLSALATWIPALLAARRDPAAVLAQEP